jgi:RecA-family ATPase
MGTGGSTAWNNTMRSRMYLTKPERENDDDPLPDPDARILSRKKANYARAGEEIGLIWKNGVIRPVDGQARADGPAPIPWEIIDKILCRRASAA